MSYEKISAVLFAGIIAVLPISVSAGSRTLEGWGVVKFGMTADQVAKASGGLARKQREYDIDSLRWSTTVVGYPATVEVYFRSERASEVVLSFDLTMSSCDVLGPKIVNEIYSRYSGFHSDGGKRTGDGLQFVFTFPDAKKIEYRLAPQYDDLAKATRCSLTVDYSDASKKILQGNHF